MNVVLDTNIIVSGHLNPHGAPGLILEMAVGRTFKIAYDSRILSEYTEVLSRPKFKIPADRRHAFLDVLKVFGLQVSARPWPHPLPDGSDEAFLAVAKMAHAPLITGNIKHYPAGARAGIKVVTAAEFLRDYERGGKA